MHRGHFLWLLAIVLRLWILVRGVRSELVLPICYGRLLRHARQRVRAMGVRRGEQRTTPLTIAATGTALPISADGR